MCYEQKLENDLFPLQNNKMWQTTFELKLSIIDRRRFVSVRLTPWEKVVSKFEWYSFRAFIALSQSFFRSVLFVSFRPEVKPRASQLEQEVRSVGVFVSFEKIKLNHASRAAPAYESSWKISFFLLPILISDLPHLPSESGTKQFENKLTSHRGRRAFFISLAKLFSTVLSTFRWLNNIILSCL